MALPRVTSPKPRLRASERKFPAILHHFFVFALFGVLFAEFVVVRRGMDAAGAARVVAIDAWYGVLAALILIVGFSRAIFTAKGWDYYEHNAFFWAKIGTFVAIGVLSVPPTRPPTMARAWRHSRARRSILSATSICRRASLSDAGGDGGSGGGSVLCVVLTARQARRIKSIRSGGSGKPCARHAAVLALRFG